MITTFILLALIGSYYTFVQRMISYAIKNGIDPVFVIPDGLRKSSTVLWALPFLVWSLRIGLFKMVYRKNDIGLAVVTVIASWYSQLMIYSLYSHKVKDLKDL